MNNLWLVSCSFLLSINVSSSLLYKQLYEIVPTWPPLASLAEGNSKHTAGLTEFFHPFVFNFYREVFVDP